MSASDTGEDPITPGDDGLLVVIRAPEGWQRHTQKLTAEDIVIKLLLIGSAPRRSNALNYSWVYTVLILSTSTLPSHVTSYDHGFRGY